MAIEILFGIIGYGIAELNPSEIITDYNFPFIIEHTTEFNKVAKIHNFSSVGGVIGLIVGTLNQIKNWW